MAISTNRASRPEEGTPEVSFIIVARNEESAIGRCIESVVAEATGLNAEVIVVDSSSTDATVNIACGFPITVLRLRPNPHLCPSAGRYVGSAHSNGQFLAFFDGDMVVVSGWIDAALAAFEDPSLAAVGGWLYRVPPGEDLTMAYPVRRRPPGRVDHLGGAAVYRRSVLDLAGGFNPHLRGEEEKELGFRIRQAGGWLTKIDAPMAYHLDKERVKAEIDEKAGYFTGAGQIVRHYRFAKIARWASRPLFPSIALLTAAFAGALTCFWLFATAQFLTLALAMAIVAAAGLIVTQLKGRARTMLYLRSLTLRAVHFLRGFAIGLPTPSTYHPQVDVVQRASVATRVSLPNASAKSPGMG